MQEGELNMKRITVIATTLSLLLAPVAPAPAISLNWTNQAGGSWESAGNWNPNVLPNPTNRVTIANGSYTVLINDTTADTDPGGASSWMTAVGTTVPALTLGQAGTSPTLLVNFTNTSRQLLLSSGTGGSLRMLGGSQFVLSNGTVVVAAGSVQIGDAAGANPTLGLYTPGALLLVTNSTITIGSDVGGTGTVDVVAGTLTATDVVVGSGTLANGSAMGTWRARGNSTNSAVSVTVGNFTNSVGYLYVEDNAVTTFNNLRIAGGTAGGASNATGYAYVTGGSLSVTGTAANVIGSRANSRGFLIVSNTGTVDFRGDVNVGGGGAGSYGEIQVVGGKLTSGGILTLGDFSTGVVKVAGAGVLELQSNLAVGGGGALRGYLTNANGGTVQFTGLNHPTVTVGATSSFVTTNAVIEFKNASAFVTNVFSKITFQGGNTLSLLNSTNANLGAYTFGSGQNFSTLRLAGTDSAWQSTILTIGAGGSLIGDGRIHSANVTNEGTIAPGSSPGTLSFSNNLTLLSSSILEMELAGTNAGSYDELLVDGSFVRDGTLTISLLSYTPAAGDAFDLFDFGSVSGFFATTNLPALGSGLAWDFTQFDSLGILSVSVVIPEPSALVMLLVAGLGLAWRRRRAL
jgi:hypothetical protein